MSLVLLLHHDHLVDVLVLVPRSTHGSFFDALVEVGLRCASDLGSVGLLENLVLLKTQEPSLVLHNLISLCRNRVVSHLSDGLASNIAWTVVHSFVGDNSLSVL